MNGSDPKLSARELLEEAHPALVGLSHWIHANPEVGFEETLASGWVAEWLVTGGFQVETGVAGMPTAVVGRSGPGPLHVAICVEYDALPEVGHACGHNIIAAAGVGAGLALASVAAELGLRVTVLGTPAEETGGGKLRLIDAGAFDGVHAALMVHPWPVDVATPNIIAVNQLEVTYTGREAHAAGFPERGLNAADALVIAQTAIGLLRQQLLPTDRVHGIVTRGGDAPNIIPAHTTALFMVRAHDRARMAELTRLVTRCFEAGALATGTTVDVVEGTMYSNMLHDPDLAALYRHNAERLGRVFDGSTGSPVSTDMGNVSHLVPSIHPMIGIAADGAVNHQAAFTAACATPSADQAILDGALAMAWTVIDAAQDEVLRGRLIADGLAREALDLAEQADELEYDALVLAETAEAIATEDPEIAQELAMAAIALDSEAQDLDEEAVERLGEAATVQEGAIQDQVAGDLASDAEDLGLTPFSGEAASIEDEADTLATGAWAFAAASDEALDEVADDATVAVDATEEAGDLHATADTLADEAVELSGQAAVLAAEADALSERYADVAPSDPDAADILAADAFDLESRADATADEADATYELALDVEADAEAADELAEVATEAAEDAESEAEVEAMLATALAGEALRTDDLAEVVQEANEDDALEAGNDAVLASMFAGAAVPDAIHADWEQQFQSVETHATWEDEYSRALTGSDGPSGDAAPADAVGSGTEAAMQAAPEAVAEPAPETEAEDAWYSGAPVPDAPDAVTDSAEPAAGQDVETPLGDFEWIPAAPTKEP